MSVARKRKAAAARLGIEFQKRYERLAFANGADEVTVAAVDLGTLFQDNIEFVINVLKAYGGMDVKFEQISNDKVAQSSGGNSGNLRLVGERTEPMP